MAAIREYVALNAVVMSCQYTVRRREYKQKGRPFTSKSLGSAVEPPIFDASLAALTILSSRP